MRESGACRVSAERLIAIIDQTLPDNNRAVAWESSMTCLGTMKAINRGLPHRCKRAHIDHTAQCAGHSQAGTFGIRARWRG